MDILWKSVKIGFATLILLSTLSSCDSEGTECTLVCDGSTPEYTDIPNLGLEEWLARGNRYMEPAPDDFWTTGNAAHDLVTIDQLKAPITVFRGSADSVDTELGQLAKSGFGAIMITRPYKLFPGLPEIATGGTVAMGEFLPSLANPKKSIKFGQPFNKRVKKVSGYYKYFPVDGDSLGLYAFMRKYRLKDDCTCKLDTIGWARIASTATVDQWTQFDLTLDYTSEEEPDDLVIYFASSDDADDLNGGFGSTLLVDEVEVEYFP